MKATGSLDRFDGALAPGSAMPTTAKIFKRVLLWTVVGGFCYSYCAKAESLERKTFENVITSFNHSRSLSDFIQAEQAHLDPEELVTYLEVARHESPGKPVKFQAKADGSYAIQSGPQILHFEIKSVDGRHYALNHLDYIHDPNLEIGARFEKLRSILPTGKSALMDVLGTLIPSAWAADGRRWFDSAMEPIVVAVDIVANVIDDYTTCNSISRSAIQCLSMIDKLQDPGERRFETPENRKQDQLKAFAEAERVRKSSIWSCQKEQSRLNTCMSSWQTACRAELNLDLKNGDSNVARSLPSRPRGKPTTSASLE